MVVFSDAGISTTRWVTFSLKSISYSSYVMNHNMSVKMVISNDIITIHSVAVAVSHVKSSIGDTTHFHSNAVTMINSEKRPSRPHKIFCTENVENITSVASSSICTDA